MDAYSRIMDKAIESVMELEEKVRALEKEKEILKVNAEAQRIHNEALMEELFKYQSGGK